MAVNQYYICFHRSISLLELLNLLRCSECRKRNLLIQSSLEHFKRRIKRSPSFAHPKPEGQYRLWSSQFIALFVWLIIHRPTVLFSQNKLGTSQISRNILHLLKSSGKCLSCHVVEDKSSKKQVVCLGPAAGVPMATWNKNPSFGARRHSMRPNQALSRTFFFGSARTCRAHPRLPRNLCSNN
jgi:hypothetical protein